MLEAERTIFFQKDGKLKQKGQVPALEIRMQALRALFLLQATLHAILTRLRNSASK